jgi:hypothetical protein
LLASARTRRIARWPSSRMFLDRVNRVGFAASRYFERTPPHRCCWYSRATPSA